MTSTPDPGLAVAYRIAASVTWADIGARDGKTGKVAKRDAKRLAKKTSAAARLKANASRGVVLRSRPCGSMRGSATSRGVSAISSPAHAGAMSEVT